MHKEKRCVLESKAYAKSRNVGLAFDFCHMRCVWYLDATLGFYTTRKVLPLVEEDYMILLVQNMCEALEEQLKNSNQYSAISENPRFRERKYHGPVSISSSTYGSDLQYQLRQNRDKQEAEKISWTEHRRREEEKKAPASNVPLREQLQQETDTWLKD